MKKLFYELFEKIPNTCLDINGQLTKSMSEVKKEIEALGEYKISKSYFPGI